MRRLTHLRIVVPAVSLALLALAIGVASYATREAKHTTTREAVHTLVRERLNQLQISSELFLQLSLRDQLQQLIASVASERDLMHILMVDADGRIIAADRQAMVGENWRDAAVGLDPAQVAVVQASKSVRTWDDPEDRYVDGFASLCGRGDYSVLRPTDCGFIAYRVDLRLNYAHTDQALRQQTAYFGAGILAVFVALMLLLDLLVTRRAGRITAALDAFVGGQRDARIPVILNDELTAIGRTINSVLDEVQRNEHAIVAQRERVRAVLNTVEDAIITIDGRGIIQTVNPATETLFGYARGELVGNNVSMLMPGAVAAQHDRYLNDYLETGRRKVIGIGREVQAKKKSGDTFAAELSVSEMSIGGERMFTGVVRDVSERVEMREAMERVNAELINTNQALWQSAKTDGLTGLANRRHFDDTLDAEIRRAVRHGNPLSLLLIDLDYFKGYNDHYGHYDGDKCLKATAGVLADTCQRGGELPARYGGEEFAVILPYTDSARALETAERIRAGIEGLRLAHEKSRVSDWVTGSIGVTTYEPHSSTPVEDRVLIKAADSALYLAKASGRNRVCQADVDDSRGGGARMQPTRDQPAP